MSELSDAALDLLRTLKRMKGIQTQAGKFIPMQLAQVEYGYKQNGKELSEPFAELVDKGFLKKQQGDAYQLLPKGSNHDFLNGASTNIFSGTFHSSPIANNSSNVHQTIDMSSYSSEIRNEITELREAVAAKDSRRAQSIIDGLWVSAPALALQLLQIGLSSAGGRS